MESHSYAEGDKDINYSKAKDGHPYIPFLRDSIYRRRPNRRCFCYRRSPRGPLPLRLFRTSLVGKDLIYGKKHNFLAGHSG